MINSGGFDEILSLKYRSYSTFKAVNLNGNLSEPFQQHSDAENSSNNELKLSK